MIANIGQQNVGQNPKMKATNKSLESIPKFKYCGKYFDIALINNACYRPIQSLLFSRPLIKNNLPIKEADPGGRAVSAAA